MSTSMRDKIARKLELELEKDSRALGSAKYSSTRPLPWRKESSTTEGEAALPLGRKLVKVAIEPSAAEFRSTNAQLEMLLREA